MSGGRSGSDIGKEFSHIKSARVRRESSTDGDLSRKHGTIWHFLVEIDPLLRTVLDHVGKAEWGRGFLRKAYEISSPPAVRDIDWEDAVAGRHSFTWSVSSKADTVRTGGRAFGTVMNRTREQYSVAIEFDEQDGLPSGCTVQGEEDMTSSEVTAEAITEAFKIIMQDGPATEIIYD